MPVSESGEESPFLFHLGDLAHPEAKRRGPVADLLLAREMEHALKGFLQHGLQLREPLLFGPVEALQVLDPFEIRDGYSSRIT